MTDSMNDREYDAASVLQQAGAVWQTRLRPALEDALRELPEEEELILRLSYYQQLPDTEIVSTLDLAGGEGALPLRRAEALRALATAGWGRGMTPEGAEVLLKQAGEGWRISVASPLDQEALTTADQAVARALGRVSASVGSSEDIRKVERASDRSSLRPAGGLRLVVMRRVLSIAAVLLVGLYGTLWLVGRTGVPDTFTIASVDAYEETLQESVRSADGDTPDAFKEGAAALLAARQQTLGLFPRYDTEQVERAVVNLEQTFDTTQDPFLKARAGFFLAKAHLMRGDVAAARTWLSQVLALETAAYREDAQGLLDALEALEDKTP